MYLDAERSTYQKVILCIFAAMAVIFAVWTAVSRTHEGVLFREELLEISQQGDTTVYGGTVYGTPVTITSREENGTKYVNFSADGEYYAKCRVEYPRGTIRTEFGKDIPRIRIFRNDELLFSGGYDSAPDSQLWYLRYYNEDGTYTMTPSVSVYAGGVNPWTNFEFTTGDIVRFSGNPATSARGSWGIYFITLFITILCSLLTAFPETVFYLRHFLHVYNPEPTDLYYVGHKISSAIFVVMLLISYIKGVNTIV